MLISVNQFRNWLRDNANTLRKGGAGAVADVYEEIEQQLAAEAHDLREHCDSQVAEAEALARDILSEYQQRRMVEAGLMVVPSAWRWM